MNMNHSFEEINGFGNPWNVLQQPTHPVGGLNSSLRTLLAALDQGWQVVEPVQKLVSRYAAMQTYSCVITHSVTGQTNILTIPAIPEVDSLIAQQSFQVIEGTYLE